MAAKSFGSFGTYKFKYFEDSKKNINNQAIVVSNLNHTVLKDVEYFRKDSNRSDSNQIVNYTWEKPSDLSPSTYTKVHEVKDSKSLVLLTHQNTLDMMAPYKGLPHVVKQNKWETDPSDPPKFLPYPQQRRTAIQSSMTQYVEEMNKVFPGHSMY